MLQVYRNALTHLNAIHMVSKGYERPAVVARIDRLTRRFRRSTTFRDMAMREKGYRYSCTVLFGGSTGLRVYAKTLSQVADLDRSYPRNKIEVRDIGE